MLTYVVSLAKQAFFPASGTRRRPAFRQWSRSRPPQGHADRLSAPFRAPEPPSSSFPRQAPAGCWTRRHGADAAPDKGPAQQDGKNAVDQGMQILVNVSETGKFRRWSRGHGHNQDKIVCGRQPCTDMFSNTKAISPSGTIRAWLVHAYCFCPIFDSVPAIRRFMFSRWR
jgi:hypothetical protein